MLHHATHYPASSSPGATPVGIVRPRLRHPNSLDAALRIAASIAPNLQHLACVVLPVMPRMPRASQNLRAITRDHHSAPMPLSLALGCPWMALDSATHRNALLIDIDHDDALDRCLALPTAIRPTLVIDAWSGRAHAILPLAAPVCLSPAGRDAPRRLADYAGRLLAAALDGTLLPAGSLSKSPWGTTRDLIGALRRIGPRPVFPECHADAEAAGLTWSTLPGAGCVNLREIVAALAPYFESDARLSSRIKFKPRRSSPDDARGRNCTLFTIVRYWAYDRAERDGAVIHAEACRANALFIVPLPDAEVAALARSITRFMNTRYKPRAGRGAGRGRDAALTAGMQAHQAQAVAGRRTAEVRRNNTHSKLLTGVADLQASGRALTQSKLAVVSGLSMSTVKRAWKAITAATNGMSEACCPGCQSLSYQVIRPGERQSEEALSSVPGVGVVSDAKRRVAASAYLGYALRRTAELSRRGFRLRRDTRIREPSEPTAEMTGAWMALRGAFERARRRMRSRRRRRESLRVHAFLRGLARRRCALIRNRGFAGHIAKLVAWWRELLARIKDPEDQQRYARYCTYQIAARRRWWREALREADRRRA